MEAKNNETLQGFDYKSLKLWEDFCKVKNVDPLALPGVDKIPEEFREALVAAYKIMFRCYVLKNGVKLDWATDQRKYFPYFRVVPDNKAVSGFRWVDYGYGYACSASFVGSRLSVDDSDKALHLGEYAIEDYSKLFLESGTPVKYPDFNQAELKTFADYCKIYGVDENILPDVSMIPEFLREAVISVYKLFIRCKVLKNGKKLDWNNSSEGKYFPWYDVEADNKAVSGFRLVDYVYYFTSSNSYVGSRLSVDDSGKAMFLAENAIDEYSTFFLE
jgi:hypothetical protein